MFLKHFASKNQLPGLSVSGTLVENGLNGMIDNFQKQLIWDVSKLKSTQETTGKILDMVFNSYEKLRKPYFLPGSLSDTCFFYKQHFYRQHQAEIGKKNQAKAKQHPEAELLLFENYLLSSSTLSLKNNRGSSKNV